MHCKHMSASSKASIHTLTTQHVLKSFVGSRQRGSRFHKVQLIKKNNNPTWIWLRNSVLVQRRPLLTCSSVVNCLCMSEWLSNITRWFVANREDGDEPKKSLISTIFPLPQSYWEPLSLAIFHTASIRPLREQHSRGVARRLAGATLSIEGSGNDIGSISTTRRSQSELSFWRDSNGNHLSTWEECHALIRP